MSTDTTPDRLRWLGLPGGVRFRPRDEPPDPLFGPPNVNYPGCDGRPMADNTLQFEWIARIKGGLDVVFQNDPDVFVAGNLMWYPVEGNNRRRLAPDAMVIFGRPKGYRDSYVVHEEDGIGPQVVFEVLSPSNRKRVMDFKRKIYELYGVEEYYVFNPYKIRLEVWLRENDAFQLIPEASGWVSPRLGIRFELAEDMTIFAPDGRPFLDYVDVARERDEERIRAVEERRLRAESGRLRAESDRQRAESERQAEEERLRAVEERRLRAESERQADEERLRAVEERRQADEERRLRAESERQADEERRQRIESDQRAERLAAKLRELGLEPEE